MSLTSPKTLALMSLVTACVLLSCDAEPAPRPSAPLAAAPAPTRAAPPQPPPGPATYVGRRRCGTCHAEQFRTYAGSQHDRALEEPLRANVRAPFAGETLETAHLKARFETQEGVPVIRSGGALPVHWAIGVEPLQQYLVDVGAGRVQAFPAPFDTRPASEGGERWYMQPELDVPEGDLLHWRGPAMSWNANCADCHSTHFQKRYDYAQDAYESSFAEIDVSCEACHGPASTHVWLAESSPAQLSTTAAHGFERHLARVEGRRWVRGEGEKIAHLEGATTGSDEQDACARCHSRRADLGGEDLAYDDRYRLQLIEPPYYHPDGQILDEVYVYGSFLQSKMQRAGVTCSDCHDPHSARLKLPEEKLCSQCHDPGHYDAKGHHMHEAGLQGGPRCVDCHMPSRVYMGIDARRDHRLGVPRPDLSVTLGTPNPCTACHAKRGPAWAAASIAKVHGPQRPFSPWPAVHALRDPASAEAVQAVARIVADRSAAAVVRASALLAWSISRPPDAAFVEAVQGLAGAKDPLLRRAAAQASAALPSELRVALLTPLWTDRYRVVRTEAVMAHLGDTASPQGSPPGFVRALKEARETRLFDADSREGLLALGAIELRLGLVEQAVSRFERAAERFAESQIVFVNWADALRVAGQEVRAGKVLERGLSEHPRSAELHHAQGLWLVRQGRKTEALEPLKQAVELAEGPARDRYAYVYRVAMQSVDSATPPSGP